MIVELWTAIAAVGALAGAWGVIEALRDRSALIRLSRNGTDLLVAHQRLFAQVTRFGVTTAWTLLGVDLLLRGYRTDDWTVAAIVLMASNVALTIVALRDVEVGHILRTRRGPG